MTTKAATYIGQLDRARCEGNWGAIPELVRKVRKHAPERTCLTLTAEAECAVSNATSAASTMGRPATSHHPTNPNADSGDLNVPAKLPALLQAIDSEDHFHEDRYQAQVCVGWLHWVVAEYSLALSRLPTSGDQQEGQFDTSEAVSEWTTVCALKAAYLKANCLSRNYQRKEALQAYHSGLPALGRVWSGGTLPKQLSYWTELFLTEFCILFSQTLEENKVSLADHNSVACYRSWSKFWELTSTPTAGGYGFRNAVPRRKVWNDYYVALSRILEEDLPFPTGYLGKITNETSARAQLRVELKNIEATYQNLLLKETSFPRAEEERAEIEAFARLVVKNWSILCGRGWREQDLGHGGRSSISRGVLDILYSASTRTFHSTSILRSLFLVHLSVGEFDLAFKAFDSYLDIVKKGKARVDKTGHPEPSLDDDGTVLQTMAQAVIALCHYGHPNIAEKARHIGAEIEDWLARLPQLKQGTNGFSGSAQRVPRADLHPPIPPKIVALSWQAIGLSQAHWSRITHEAAYRTEIQARAIRCLRRSLAAEFGRSKDVRSFFSLGVLLAERRELTAAIDIVKAALISSQGQDESYDLRLGSYWKERSLIPMWHLLALLLSARQDYVMAARACEGALEQFKDPALLFGDEKPDYRSEHLNDAEEKSFKRETPKSLVDEMDDTEKEAILEVKMTQLALVELIEGPDVAVNASFELLTLYSRLFGGDTAYTQPMLNPPIAAEPPKTSGTLRSIKGTIFGGRDKSRPPTKQQSVAAASEKSASTSDRPGTSRTAASHAPTVQVTGDGNARSSGRNSSGYPHKSDSKQIGSLKKRDRSASRSRVPSSGATSQPENVVDGELFYTPAPAVDSEQSDFFIFSKKRQPSSMSSFSRGTTLPTLNSYLSTASKSSDPAELPPDMIHGSADLLPLVQFSKDKEMTRRTTILIRVWLMVAAFYRRADMYDDCKGAVGEAQKLVQALEADAIKESSAVSGTRNAGWAEKKSIEDLWGDVHTELGHMSLARGAAHDARSEFESALLHSPNHPDATVGLSTILLDIYCEKLRPTPPITPSHTASQPGDAGLEASTCEQESRKTSPKILPSIPLGLYPTMVQTVSTASSSDDGSTDTPETTTPYPRDDDLPEPYKATGLPLVDRLAARDRAYALLSGLTRLGCGWNHSEAWFTLARAYEESSQLDKAKEVLWWCVELEEAKGVRGWQCVGGGGYVL